MRVTTNGLTASQQRYLATIVSLELDQGRARPGEIAARIGVNRPSTTAALRILAERGMVLYEPYGAVTLTQEGRQTAGIILARTRVIRQFLVRFLHIEKDTADDAALRMQYSVPDIVIDRFSAHLEGLGE